jgi:DNA-binding transcriptional ArsR family regulator
MLDLLCQGPKSVETLARETGMSLANTSQHLQTLRAARLVEADKEGLHVIYWLADRMVCEFFRSTRVPAENRLAEVESIKRQFLWRENGRTQSKARGQNPNRTNGLPFQGISRGVRSTVHRTRKLSLSAPMVLHGQLCGRVGRRRNFFKTGTALRFRFFLWRTRIA